MRKHSILRIALCGVAAGAVNGLFGAGGGMVLVPLLALMTDLEDVIAPQPTEILPPYNVQVYTLSGQVILQQTNVMAADLNALGSGMYIVQYEKNGQRVAKKVIR